MSKIRDSGMPDEGMWREFFDADTILDAMGVHDLTAPIVDLGCGYGTFSIPASRRTRAQVYAFDIEQDMLAETQRKAEVVHAQNVLTVLRDFVGNGTGLTADSCAFVMAFNILHAVEPWRILDEAFRILAPGGNIGVMHWNPDPGTPRGPALDIRPTPEQCRAWMVEAGFEVGATLDLPPYHFGLVGKKR